MKRPRITWRTAAVAFGVLLIAAGFIAPTLQADHFGERIRQALEDSLGRRVEVADVRFNLFRGPGFTLRKVVIHEDPSAGIEPFAYVASLQARIRLRSLWTGKMEFASLRLVEPSVNLVKTTAGPWNFQPLLGRAMAADLPEIRVRSGRLNFKFGDVKSVFYFTNADVDMTAPPESGRPFGVYFRGEPARTDRTAQGFGTLTGRGRWVPARDPGSGGESDGRLELDVNLERSAIAEIATLIRGYDVGLHGHVAAQIRVSGPVSALAMNGRLRLDEIHWWDSMPPYAGGGLVALRGRVDLLSQRLELETIPDGGGTLPFSVRLRAADYLSAPRWAVSVTLNEAPVRPLVEVARHLGVAAAPQLEADGRLSGAVGYSADSGLQGRLALQAGVIRTPSVPEIAFEDLQLVLDRDSVRLASALAKTRAGQTVRLDGGYSLGTGGLDLRMTTSALSVDDSFAGGGPLPVVISVPLLGEFRGGTWDGWLRYRHDAGAEGEWSGAIQLNDTRVSVPGFSERLEVSSANVDLRPDRLLVEELHGRLGELEVTGNYRYDPRARRPHLFHLRLARLEASELETLLAPALRRPRGLLSRTLGLGRRAVPAWLEGRHAEGILEIDSFTVADQRFENLRARVFWDQAAVEVTHVEAAVDGGQFSGYARANLSGPQPAYEIGGTFESVRWKGGRLSGDGMLRTAGSGAELTANAQAEGSFTGQSIEFFPEVRFDGVAGCYDLTWARKQPRLRLSCLRLESGNEVYFGRGSTTSDGRLRIELANGNEQEIHLAGTLAPFELQLASASSVPGAAK